MKEANRRIFIFPVWWNDTPAIIKGFIDKVMKKQFAYNVGATGVIGHLKNIQRVEVMTTLPHPPGIRKCSAVVPLKVFSSIQP